MADVDHELGAIRFIVVSWLNSLSHYCVFFMCENTHTMAEIYNFKMWVPREFTNRYIKTTIANNLNKNESGRPAVTTGL